MKKFTGSYANTEQNFVILNLNTDEQIKYKNIYSILCVIQNIIQRGMFTRPSIFLKEKLGNLNTDVIKEPYYLVSNDLAEWNNIKGDTVNSDYPAEKFYNEILPEYLGESIFLRNLIIPEAEISEIIGHSTALDGQQVDFFIPQLKLVIEIDGSSHDELVQSGKDKLRDRELERNGVKVIRIKSTDLKKETEIFKSAIKMMADDMKNNLILCKYNKYTDIANDNIRIKYDTVFRLQIAFIECMKSGKIDFTREVIKVNISSKEISNIEELAKIAYEDIYLWINPIKQLLKEEFSIPELIICENNSADLKIDISIYERYTDITINDFDTIYIRGDYFCNNDYYKIAISEMLKYMFSEDSEKEDEASLHFLLKNIFGFDEFNEGQIPIIKNVLERNDTIGILPTGGGKSLTYQFCAIMQPGVTVVVEPIISLIQDQKKSMDRIQFNRTGYISSVLEGKEKESALKNFGDGKYQMIWCSPERFQNKSFRNTFVDFEKNIPLSTAVIDEVHCLSEWGHDFRVSYLALISTIRQYCPDACLLGLTATASQAVLEDLKVEFDDAGSAVKALPSMNRDELMFERITVENDLERLKEIEKIIKLNNDVYENKDGTTKKRAGLIFCPTVKNSRLSSNCNDIASFVKNLDIGVQVSEYYGKLDSKEKADRQQKFMNGEFDVMVCTKAFGMGIDKDNVKYTIHSSLPQSIESFYQEAGRAGREKDKSVKSHCYIIYNPEKASNNRCINQIFNLETDINERKRLSSQLSGDLSTLMYFWNINKKTVTDEYSVIRVVLTYLYNRQFIIKFGNKNEKLLKLEDIQSALYKIYLLGIIDNWNVQYNSLNDGFVEVEYLELNEKRMYKRLMSYIHKYDSEFQLDVPSPNYMKYYKILHSDKKYIHRLFEILIEWSNDNVLYNRLQSMSTMMQWMDPAISDEQFRNNIDAYFRFSEVTVLFDNIVHNPKDYKIWFDVLCADEIKNNGAIDFDNIKKSLASLQRYLESYKNNTGLNFLCGILRIVSGDFLNTEGEWRLRYALDNINKTFSNKQIEEIFKETLCIGKYCNDNDKDILSCELINKFAGCERYIFDKLHDRYSLSLLLEEPINRIKNILDFN